MNTNKHSISIPIVKVIFFHRSEHIFELHWQGGSIISYNMKQVFLIKFDILASLCRDSSGLIVYSECQPPFWNSRVQDSGLALQGLFWIATVKCQNQFDMQNCSTWNPFLINVGQISIYNDNLERGKLFVVHTYDKFLGI